MEFSGTMLFVSSADIPYHIDVHPGLVRTVRSLGTWYELGCTFIITIFRFCTSNAFNWVPTCLVFATCTVCHLRGEPRSGEWMHCVNAYVSLAYHVLRRMYAQLRLRVTAFACIWDRDRGSPRKWRIPSPSTIRRLSLGHTNICVPFSLLIFVFD